jgi:hypothetical protein
MRGHEAIRAAFLVAAVAAGVCTERPAAAQTMRFLPAGSIPGPADLIEVRGTRAYVVSGKTLTVFDVSDPRNPVGRGAHTFPDKIWGILVAEPLVYVAADLTGVGILDVSSPSAPVLRATVKTPGQAKNIALVGKTALVADHMSGIDFLDVSSADTPVVRESFFLEGYARDVASAGSLAYAIDAPAGLYVFDLTAPGPIEPKNAQQSATAPASIVLSDEPTPSLAVLVGGGLLQAYDLATPGAPTKAATFKTASGRPLRAAMKGRVAYVADGREGLQVVDFSDRAAPRLAGAYKTAAPARDVAVSGPLVFIALGTEEDGEVLILRVP